jgi:hypothetical protein
MGTFEAIDDDKNNNKKSTKPTLKSHSISLETKADRDFNDECERFLSKESIFKIVSEKKCCKKKCLLSISKDYLKGDTRDSYTFVYLLRKLIIAQSKRDRTKKIIELLEGKTV